MSWVLKLDGFRNVVDGYFHVQHNKLGLQLLRALWGTRVEAYW